MQLLSSVKGGTICISHNISTKLFSTFAKAQLVIVKYRKS